MTTPDIQPLMDAFTKLSRLARRAIITWLGHQAEKEELAALYVFTPGEEASAKFHCQGCIFFAAVLFGREDAEWDDLRADFDGLPVDLPEKPVVDGKPYADAYSAMDNISRFAIRKVYAEDRNELVEQGDPLLADFYSEWYCWFEAIEDERKATWTAFNAAYETMPPRDPNLPDYDFT